jgi:hypothetical protein
MFCEGKAFLQFKIHLRHFCDTDASLTLLITESSLRIQISHLGSFEQRNLHMHLEPLTKQRYNHACHPIGRLGSSCTFIDNLIGKERQTKVSIST